MLCCLLFVVCWSLLVLGCCLIVVGSLVVDVWFMVFVFFIICSLASGTCSLSFDDRCLTLVVCCVLFGVS